MVSLFTQAIALGSVQHFRALLHTEPVARTMSQLLDPFHPADPGCQFGAQESRVRRFMGQSPNRNELLVDRVGCQSSGF